jgi:hypothetical protein
LERKEPVVQTWPKEEAHAHVKRKKKLAKDDTMQNDFKRKSLKSSFGMTRPNFFESNDKSPNSPTRQNVFLIDRSFKEGQTTTKRMKRKMSATALNFND